MNNKANHSQGVLLFKLNSRQLFAMGTLKVKELVRYSSMSRLPNSHDTIIGTATIRNRNVPIVDMAKAVGYRAITSEELKDSYIIITDCQRKEVGFLVRGIDKIVNCNWRDIKPPPSSVGQNAFLTGVAKIEDKIIQLLDVELVLSHIYPEDSAGYFPSLTDIQREMVKPLNILIVDDSRVARKQLSDALNGLNIPYKVACNGHEALEIMKSNAQTSQQVHLLVSDIEMPGLDGYELSFEVKNTPSLANAYIILHTSLSSEMSLSQAHQVGANEALTKFDATELIEAILRGAKHHYELSKDLEVA